MGRNIQVVAGSQTVLEVLEQKYRLISAVIVALGDVVVSVLATGPKVAG
jgi:hypothetical protein